MGQQTLEGPSIGRNSSRLLFQSETSRSHAKLSPQRQRMVTEDIQEDIEHKYPFKTQIKGDSLSINTKSMRVSVKKPSQFDDPHKLSRGQVTAPTHAGVDLPYTQSRSSRAKTLGLFATDPQRTAVTKHEGEHQVKGRNELLRRNQRMKDYLER